MDRRCRTLVTEQAPVPALGSLPVGRAGAVQRGARRTAVSQQSRSSESPFRASGHECFGTNAATSEVDVRFCKVTKGATASA